MEENSLVAGIKRLISLGGFFFVLLIIFIGEKQTNFLFHKSVNGEIEILDKLKKQNPDTNFAKLLNKEYISILDDVTRIKPLRVNDLETSINRIINKVKYGKENLTEAEKAIKINELEGDLKSLKTKLTNIRVRWFLYGLVATFLLLIIVTLYEKFKPKIKSIFKVKNKKEKVIETQAIQDKAPLEETVTKINPGEIDNKEDSQNKM